ncbi:transposase [Leuconostoc mesenteroides]|uniref:transposase n=1 Tax=Leuconostoc mesenteroides TaxID=1245 RepID=UPI00235FDBE6|nr:transposase [Leuconostoc mesenteroides]
MSIRYSQDFKDSLVKLHQEGRPLKSLAEVLGPSKDSITLWVKQLEKRLAIVGGRKRNFITHSLTGIERPSY